MFNFGKKDEDEDPQKALEKGRKVLNSGVSGGLTKAFMGKGFVDKMNNAMDKGQDALDMQKSGYWLAQSGMEGTAEVVSIEDTGKLVNFNPIVKLQLKVQTVMGTAFEATGESMVSKIAIPRKGDTVKIKYNPADTSQFVVMS